MYISETDTTKYSYLIKNNSFLTNKARKPWFVAFESFDEINTHICKRAILGAIARYAISETTITKYSYLIKIIAF